MPRFLLCFKLQYYYITIVLYNSKTTIPKLIHTPFIVEFLGAAADVLSIGGAAVGGSVMPGGKEIDGLLRVGVDAGGNSAFSQPHTCRSSGLSMMKQ